MTEDPWFKGKDWQEFAAVLYSPIMQRGLSKIIMAGLPTGKCGTMEQEALNGAERRGFNNFYKELVKLSILPAIPQDRSLPSLQPDPLIPEE